MLGYGVSLDLRLKRVLIQLCLPLLLDVNDGVAYRERMLGVFQIAV